MLVGRDGEQRALDALLDSARKERSAVLVLRGEPGIGKTSLLEYAQEQADGMRVLRCTGIEAEHELPFAGMHQLVRPCLDLVERLPAPQAGALQGALGLSSEVVEDRFLVSLGLLSLLAEACEDGPVLCCVDDAQWLDRPSAEALLFAARRFEAEPMALLLTVREGESRAFDTPGLPELELAPLGKEESRELLAARLGRAPAPELVASLVESAQGNPLALMELPAGLTEAQRTGAEPVLGPPPIRGMVEDQFRGRVAALPEPVRRVLLVAAADEAGDRTTVERAAGQMGLDAEELQVAERAGLVRLNGTIVFRHPLVRSAVYGAAGRTDRKAVHEALAAAVDDPVRRAWHRALVAEGTDEGIAGELEAAAVQAAGRGAAVTASAAFERAAELTEDPERKGRRLRNAAQAALDAGRAHTAAALIERARPLISEPFEQTQLALVGAAQEGRRGSLADSYALVSEAAASVAPVAPEAAYELGFWALLASFQGGWVARTLPEIERILGPIEEAGGLERVGAPLLEGVSRLTAGDAAGAGGPLRRAREVAQEMVPSGPVPGAGVPRSGGNEDRRATTLTTMSGFLCFLTADFPAARRIISRVVAEHRAQGSLVRVAAAMPALSFALVGERRVREAEPNVLEGLEIMRQAGYENDEGALLAVAARVAAFQGREQECRDYADAALRRCYTSEIGWAANNARVALAELELGVGNPEEAVHRLGELTAAYIQPMAPLAAPDLIDALLRLGERDRAVEELARLEHWAPVSEAPQVREIVGRSRAVLAEDPAVAEELFAEVLATPGHEVPAYERARTHLANGERLRREKRKSEARGQLRVAAETFEGLGATPWADRARSELQATGERARKRDVSTLDDLTPQELRIAQLVAGGATNPEVAARLFVSAKTVEYHLRKVFRKLGVKSRVELARVPLGEPAAERDEAVVV